MADDYVINPGGHVGNRAWEASVSDRSFNAEVGADDYWVENVGGEVWVGGGHKHLGKNRGKYRSHNRDGFSYADSPLFYTIAFDDDGGIVKKSYDDDTQDNKGANVAGFFDFITKPAKAIVHAAGDVVHAVNKAASKAGKAIAHIPVVSTLVHATLKLDPIHVLGGISAKVLKGERLDKVFLDTAKEQVAAAREVAPFVKTAMAFIPGVGTGIAAAIAAGTALAEGRTITDAIMNGVMNAVPGGAIAQAAAKAASALAHGESIGQAAIDAAKSQLPAVGKIAADIAVKIAKGENVSKSVIDNLKNQLPAAARGGVDIALAAAKGQNIKTAALHLVRSVLPEAAQKAVDIGTAITAARNIQASTVNALTSPKAIAPITAVGVKAVAASPALAKAVVKMAEPQKAGFHLAAGVLAHKGVNAHALVAMRNKLPVPQREGFDHAVKTFNNLQNPQWGSMVSKGHVLRGDWKPSSKGATGAVFGRVVKDGKVNAGWFARV